MKNFRHQIVAATKEAAVDSDMEGSVIFRVTKSEIASLSTDRIVAFLHPNIRGLNGLSFLLGNVTVTLPDSDAMHGEPFLCDQSRKFCASLYYTLPFWGFFFSLRSMALWKLSLGLLQNTRVMQCGRSCDTKFYFDVTEINQMIDGHLRDLRQLGEWINLPGNAIEIRESALREYFDRLLVAHAL